MSCSRTQHNVELATLRFGVQYATGTTETTTLLALVDFHRCILQFNMPNVFGEIVGQTEKQMPEHLFTPAQVS